MNIFDYLLDLVYPHKNRCLHCGKTIDYDEVGGLCYDCLKKINFISKYCSICGREYAGGNTDICQECRRHKPFFEQARAVALYEGLFRELILKFKYDGQKELLRPFGGLMYLYFSKYYKNKDIEYILSVPLSEEKKIIRGFNQADLLARELAQREQISYLDDYLVRSMDTLPFWNLDYQQRKREISGIFKIQYRYNRIKGKNILLIDDIFTTGATTNEISKILKEEARVKRVYILTLATAASI